MAVGLSLYRMNGWRLLLYVRRLLVGSVAGYFHMSLREYRLNAARDARSAIHEWSLAHVAGRQQNYVADGLTSGYARYMPASRSEDHAAAVVGYCAVSRS